MKFEIGDKVIRPHGLCWEDKKEFRVITEITEGGFYKLDDLPSVWEYFELELYKEDCKVEKTFKEVIANIKENEVWESRNPINGVFISKDVNGISIRDKKGNSLVWFSDLWIFTLQRKEYTFDEAFKAYEEGKEIESESYKYKKCNGADCFKLITSIKDEWIKCENGFEIHLDEIRGKWYIND